MQVLEHKRQLPSNILTLTGDYFLQYLQSIKMCDSVMSKKVCSMLLLFLPEVLLIFQLWQSWVLLFLLSVELVLFSLNLTQIFTTFWFLEFSNSFYLKKSFFNVHLAIW